MKPVYKRVLLKLSGEVLAGEKGVGIDFDKVLEVCEKVKDCVDMGVQVKVLLPTLGTPTTIARSVF